MTGPRSAEWLLEKLVAVFTGHPDSAGKVGATVRGIGTGGAFTVEQKTYKVKSGEVSGSATAKQLPELPCKLVCIVAVASNAGNVYVGGPGVTKVDGTTDATTGYELDASMQTPWIPVADLNELFIISDNAGDDITYLAMV